MFDLKNKKDQLRFLARSERWPEYRQMIMAYTAETSPSRACLVRAFAQLEQEFAEAVAD